ncbi:tRNA (guanosine(37)-N1)-methyltransferase TrmD [Petrachloros mirabilis]
MRCDVVTLFPEMVAPVLSSSMLKRAQEKGLLHVRVRNLRDYTSDKHKVADDVPYGGGAGMVLKAEPILRAVAEIRAEYEARGEQIRLLLPSPRGRLFTQAYAANLAADLRRHVILCGHYEGIDERVRLALQPEEVSVGDYVLTGGELPALVLIDAAARLVPGVLGDPESVMEESFADSLLEYPHYTRPAEVRGMTVPDILLSGHHEAIRRWRRKEALRATYQNRPDLLRDRVFTEEDRQLLDDIIREVVPVRCGEEG